MPSIRIAPDLWTSYYDLGEEVAEAGGKLFVQAHSRHLSTLLSFKSHTPLIIGKFGDIRSRYRNKKYCYPTQRLNESL